MQTPDCRAGGYYVTIRHGRMTIYALGPFNRHARALGLVRFVRLAISRAGLDPFHTFSYGTARAALSNGMPSGSLGEVLGIRPDVRRVKLGAARRLAAAQAIARTRREAVAA